MDKLPIVEVAPVNGITLLSPPIFFNSRVPVEYSTAPEFKNKRALKEAWLKR